MDWSSIISQSEQAVVSDPVRANDLEELRRYVHLPLPRAYEDLLKFSDGLQLWSSVVLSAQQVLQKNQEFQDEKRGDLCFSFAGVFFFGQDADGDLFFFRVLRSEIDEGVFVWRHEDDSRIRVSYTLEAFLKQYISGEYDAWNL